MPKTLRALRASNLPLNAFVWTRADLNQFKCLKHIARRARLCYVQNTLDLLKVSHAGD